MDHNGQNGHGGHGHNGQKRDYVRLSPVNSLGSSANSSPGDHHHHQDSPPSFSNYRSSLAYLPGSVHGASHGAPGQGGPGAPGGGGPQPNNSLPSITTLGNAVFVKQEPSENENLKRQQMMNQHQNAGQNANNTYVSSTTMAYNMNGGGPPVASRPQNASGLPKAFKGYPNPPSSQSSTSSTGSTGSKKKVDRNSDEYRRRRERNNVAVRKSREKAKMRSRETEDRVKILARENERLQKKVELLQEELAVLRSLFSNVGVLPDHIHRELSKHIDNFQQQHNAMACM